MECVIAQVVNPPSAAELAAGVWLFFMLTVSVCLLVVSRQGDENFHCNELTAVEWMDMIRVMHRQPWGFASERSNDLVHELVVAASTTLLDLPSQGGPPP